MSQGFEVWVKRDIESSKWVLHELCFDLEEALRLAKLKMTEHPLLLAKIEPVDFRSLRVVN